jgi:phosphomannomutase/phosphoglucomutase
MKFSIPRFKSKGKTSKARTGAAVPGGEAGGGVSLKGMGIILFLVILPLLLLPAGVLYWLAAQHLEAGVQREARVAAEHFADRMADWVAGQAHTLERLAGDPALARLLEAGDRDAWSAREPELGLLFPQAIRVRLIEPGVQEVDMEATPPLSYAAIDLLREAETRETPPPMEAHLFGTPQRHLNLVRRVLDPAGRRIVGHVLVSYPVEELQKVLDGPSVPGYLELQQTTQGTPLVLARRGEEGFRQGSHAAQVAIAGSRWSLALWAGDSAAGATRALGLAGLVAAACAALTLALALLLGFRRLLQALKADQVSFISLVKDMRDGRAQPERQARLRELQDALGIMSRTASAGAAAVARPAGAAKGKPPAEPSEPELLFDHNALDVAQIGVDDISVDPSIFRAYDIRGLVEQALSPEVVYEIGRAIGSEAFERGQQVVAVARDGRLSGPELTDALIRGLVATGRDVKDLGMVPTPVLYFATQYLDTLSGAMVTGSHNPPGYNGLKIVLAGETLAGNAIQDLRRRIQDGDLLSGEGSVEQVDVLPDYIERIKADVILPRPLKVVVDCGNGVAGVAAPRLLRALGCEVIELFCDIDGAFPNHHPDPSRTENLGALIGAVGEHGADLGLAFDGDGDRLGVVASGGEIIWPDRLMMLYSMDLLNRNPGSLILYDVKCSRNLAQIIRDFGGDPLMAQTGHSFIKAKMKETGALLAGEMSGHIFFQERWYGFDDALYAAARLLEILANDHRTSSSVFAMLPDSVNTPELQVPMAEGEPHPFMERLLASAHFENAHVHTIDGMRVEYPDGWGLVRASNTTPVLVLRFEADDEEILRRIQDDFRRVMLQVEPELQLPF